jgi:hypothetical protein
LATPVLNKARTVAWICNYKKERERDRFLQKFYNKICGKKLGNYIRYGLKEICLGVGNTELLDPKTMELSTAVLMNISTVCIAFSKCIMIGKIIAKSSRNVILELCFLCWL